MVSCPLKCWVEGEPTQDTQCHLLECKALMLAIPTNNIARSQVKYEDIFSDVDKQKEAVVIFERLIEARVKLLTAGDTLPPGDQLDPSAGVRLCCVNAVLTSDSCINCMNIGN